MGLFAVLPDRYGSGASVQPLLEIEMGTTDISEIAQAALRRIARWAGEFPATGCKWEDGTPISYSAAYGSNGERDYMRQVASDALAAIEAKQIEQGKCELKRPEEFEFAMDFLGTPEEDIIREYVESLEARIKELTRKPKGTNVESQELDAVYNALKEIRYTSSHYPTITQAQKALDALAKLKGRGT